MRGASEARRRPRGGRRAWLATAALALALGCAHAPVRPAPAPAEAAEAMAIARREERAAREGWRGRAEVAARRAGALDPGWVVPERFLDELARADGRAHAALAARVEALQAAVDADASAGELARLSYLVGRLEGDPGTARFGLARRLDPTLAWPWHGRAWMHFADGETRAARVAGRRALALARDPWERAFFALSLARYLLAEDEAEAAAALLRDALDEARLAADDRAEFEVWLVRAELAVDERASFESGFWRGIALLDGAALADDDVTALGVALHSALEARGETGLLEELEAVLARRAAREPAGAGGASARLRAAILAARGERAFGLAFPADGVFASSLARRAARFAADDGRAAIEDWLAALPSVVRDGEGLPRRAELAALVRVARAPAAEDVALGDALLAAGWFAEARGLAAHLARSDLAAGLALDARAVSGLALLRGVQRLFERVDEGLGGDGAATVATGRPLADEAPGPSGRPRAAPPRPDERERGEAPGGLEGVVDALEALFARHTGARPDFAATPRLGFGPVGQLLHPGPRFSAVDEAAGRGVRDEPVGGLAAAFGALGRFAIVGEALGGGGPDGTVLRLLAVEERSGAHLGVPFAGTVAWCEGVDVASRPARRGASITGAALHEGYWVDVEGVRAELELWRAVARRFAGTEGLARARAALDARGPRLGAVGIFAPSDGAHAAARAKERCRPYAPLGAADRVRLAVLLERAGGGVIGSGGSPGITLDELVAVTARHEEGHLVDRTRLLPWTAHPLQLLRLLVAAGFSPWRVVEELEYRAQLVALCVVDEPRIALAECLASAESGGGDVTVHAAAYGRLLEDWLEVLGEELERHPTLDDDRYLVHQVHRLSGAEVRAVARELAVRRGLVAGAER